MQRLRRAGMEQKLLPPRRSLKTLQRCTNIVLHPVSGLQGDWPHSSTPYTSSHLKMPKSHIKFSLTTWSIAEPLPLPRRNTPQTPYSQAANKPSGLTMAPPGKEGHPVDGDGNCAVLVVKMVDVVRSAEARRHPSRSGLNGQRNEQGQPEGQSGAVS